VKNRNELASELLDYAQKAPIYPLPLLEKFCFDRGMTVGELHELAEDNKDLDKAITLFNQKQKSLVAQLLIMEGELPVSDSSGKKTSIMIDKKGVYILANHLGIG